MGRLQSQMPHTDAWSKSIRWNGRRPEYQYSTTAGGGRTSAPSENEALTVSHYLSILSENQIDGLHIGRERKAIALSAV